MSRRHEEEEEEEEDELQMILEGRDVEDFREYHNYLKDNHRSEDSDSNSDQQRDEDEDQDSDDHNRESYHLKKQRTDTNRKKGEVKSGQIKRKVSSSENRINSVVVDDFTNEETGLKVNNETNGENVTVIKPKIRRIINRLKPLDADKLTSSEGLALLPQIFSDFKFGPKGSEMKDLNAILFRMSHWSHRLYPNLTFDDFIEKCEQLGHKNQVKNFVRRIRNDEPLDMEPNPPQLEDDPQDFDDFNDKDFDSIIANSYGNVTQNNDKQLETNGSESERQDFESNSLPSTEQQIDSNEDNQQKESEVNDKQINSKTDSLQTDDSNEEELTEEQLLNEINSEEENTI